MGWDELSMSQKADVMSLAIQCGVYDLDAIRNGYNEFAEGGNLYGGESQPTQQMITTGGAGGGEIPANTLPEVIVNGYRPIELKTYYPLGKEYPWTGHSSLNIPISVDAANDYGLYGLNSERPDRAYTLIVDKNSDAPDYNLLTNNCADETLGYLNAMFGTKETPTLFTTPGDVKDFAIKQLKGKPIVGKDGVDTVLIPRNAKNANMLSGKALERYAENTDKNTSTLGYDRFSKGGPLVDMAMKNVYDGTTGGSQQMKIGLDVGGWPDFSTEQILANAAKVRAREEAVGKQVRDYLTTSNDATAVSGGRPQNTHLAERALEGAQAHRAWEEEHPIANAWGMALGAAPFVAAAYPFASAVGAGVGALGDAAAATATGQAVTSALSPVMAAATTSYDGVPAWMWANAGLQGMMVESGLNTAVEEGGISPMTAIELAPTSPAITRAPGIIRNLTPQNARNYWYVSKSPIGYDGISSAVERWIRGVASGKKADIENPFWFNPNSAKQLETYAYVPESVQGLEREEYLRQFGEHALEARADAWRMHNLIPQKFNTFTENPRHPGSFTDMEGIRRLKWIPPQIEGTPQIDFINSVGGNVGVPTITNLGTGIADKGVQIQKYGVTTTSDWFDLNPFSRKSDKLRHRFINPIWKKYIMDPVRSTAYKIEKAIEPLRYDVEAGKDWLSKANDIEANFFDPDMFPTTGVKRQVGEALGKVANKMKEASRIPEFEFLKPVEDWMANLEAGDVTGGKPFLVKYDIPWTSKTQITLSSDKPLTTEYIPGFTSESLLPQSVFDWRGGIPFKINDDANTLININPDLNIDLKSIVTKRRSTK